MKRLTNTTYARVSSDLRNRFPGYGGVPIAHVVKRHKGYYFIDTDTIHNIVIGTSRSGKGQTLVIPMIDILSRAQKQSSMVLNDPKGELYDAAAATLRKRGYKVYLLNLADASQSMAYNPLQLIIDKWLQGDKEGAMQLVNSLTYTLYHKENAGANSWVYEGAQKAVNGMIIALMEYCIKHDCIQKVTLNNIIDMVNELGTVNYQPDPENDQFTTKNLLDEYFNHLKQGSTAKGEFMTTSFSGDKAKGSIYSTIIQQLSIFHLPKMARMTSMNSLDLKSIGFPKWLNFNLSKDYQGKLLQVAFLNKDKKLKSKYEIRVGFGGFCQYNFNTDLTSGDYCMLRLKDEDGKKVTAYQISSIRKENCQLKTLRDDLGADKVDLHYSNKPTAVFMKVPDYDSSNNALASIFISQLYSELAKQCSFMPGGKTVIRVHFILDEFGNMNPIKDMDQIMTVSAGRNLLYTLILQSYQQLYAKYGKEKGQTIKENGQNQILIKSNDMATNEEFSKQIGFKTVENSSINKSVFNKATNINVNADKVPLITPERLRDLLVGESIVLRPLHRSDLKHNDVRAFPIFNHGKTKMPYAYTFLKDEFNPDINPNLLEVDVPHANLDLASLAINWRDWITWSPLALQAYDDFKNEDKTKSDSQGSDESGLGSKGQNPDGLSEDEAAKALDDFDSQMDEKKQESSAEDNAEPKNLKQKLYEFGQENREALGETYETFETMCTQKDSDGIYNKEDYLQLLTTVNDPELTEKFNELWEQNK